MSSPSKILALDLATQTGWAFVANGIVSSGSESFHLKKGELAGRRFLKFRKWLRDQIEIVKPELIVFEDVKRHISNLSARCYCGLLATLQCECESHEILCEGIGVGTIKKAATQNGAASKADMIDAAKKLGYSPIDDNEADALALLHIFLDKHTISVTKPTKKKVL